MIDKICPLHPLAAEMTISGTAQHCLRERCAWWCPEVGMPEESGRCAIKIGMLSITQLASLPHEAPQPAAAKKPSELLPKTITELMIKREPTLQSRIIKVLAENPDGLTTTEMLRKYGVHPGDETRLKKSLNTLVMSKQVAKRPKEINNHYFACYYIPNLPPPTKTLAPHTVNAQPKDQS